MFEKIDETTVRLKSYNGNSASVTVPEVEGMTIVEIGASAFENHTELQSIKLPSTIAIIGRRAFAGCTSLSQMS